MLKTLRVRLDKPLPWFSNLTASFAFYPVQKANVESGKEWTRPGALIGNGAYVLKDRVVNEKLVVEPNTHYWDNANTVLKKSPLCQSTRVLSDQTLSGGRYRYYRIVSEKHVPEAA